ncbi:MAG: DUF2802 domain-containing protein [Oceanospirillaceae bacterium]|jgi:predicted PurR-regulated permease PerM|nr:DUF2802 domain-containing protein [Oceanospirillaceae bacterium]MBT4442704.1 DUF2802 domain-containing protein [Oceanospirillaceae bacterium]MBT6078589.1 DUF2802 domain-containing protein [Oceanospirillaceae bacterium]MBT7331421.1 DUF2802 domain-containing protein [Oceanospirillaceae bacterium]
MTFLQTLASNPQSMIVFSILVVAMLGLIIGLIALLLERQGNQQIQQRLADLGLQLLEQQEDYNKLEKLQFIGAQRQQRMDQVLQDIYSLIENNSQQLDQLKDQPNVHTSLASDVPSQSNYEHAIRMAKEGLTGERIQEICGLTEGEVNLILDLHQ